MKTLATIVLLLLAALRVHACWEVHEVSTNQAPTLPVLVHTYMTQYKCPDFTNHFARFQIWIREVSPFRANMTYNLVILRSDLGKVFDGKLNVDDRARQGVPKLDFMVDASMLKRSYLSIVASRDTEPDSNTIHIHVDEYRFSLQILYEMNKAFDVTGYTCSDDPTDEDDPRFLEFLKKTYESPTRGSRATSGSSPSASPEAPEP